MKNAGKFAAMIATAAALLALVGTSAFADWRPQDETYQRVAWQRRDVTAEGHVRSIRRERDGYRVELDRGDYSFWVPELTIRSAPRGFERMRDLRVGAFVRFYGHTDQRGFVVVSSAEWLGERGGGHGEEHNHGTLRGKVERIDLRRNTMVVRTEEGRMVNVDMLRTDSRWNRRINLDDLRRGDRVTLSGDWVRGGFSAFRIEEVRQR